jgi:hypothetical protein
MKLTVAQLLHKFPAKQYVQCRIYKSPPLDIILSQIKIEFRSVCSCGGGGFCIAVGVWTV